MITPTNSVHQVDIHVDAHQISQPPAERRPDPKARTAPVQKSGDLSNDQVTLKSAGQPDTDRD